MSPLTKEEVCKRIRISPRGLEMMIERGEFPAGARVGKRNYWSEKALENWTTRMFSVQEGWSPGLIG